MAIPAGIGVCTVTYGTDTSWLGDSVTIAIAVSPTHSLTWAATGDSLDAFTDFRKAQTGMPGTIALPWTDQAGFLDSSGNSFAGWAYRLEITKTLNFQTITTVKNLQIASGTMNLDLDLVPGGNISVPVSAPGPVVSSVNGQTGAITVNDGSVLLADAITYNSDGTVASSTSGGVVTTYGYNSDGTVHTETRNGKTKTWAYDGSGNPTGSVVV